MRTLTKLLIVVAAATLQPNVSAVAEMLPVNGHRLYLQCAGKWPGVTVILIAGGGGTTATWDKVQPGISRFARVCSYDRAGLGQSERVPKHQTAAEVAGDLKALLDAAKIRPPYVLVGHSIGGIYARKFDESNGRSVAGMILLDSSHEEQIWRFAKSQPEALAEYPRWQDRAFMSAEGFLPPEEHLHWQFTKPLIVVEHGIPPEPVWHRMQQDLASRSPDGRLITATRSSHFIQKLQPELVIEQVRSVVAECR